jgi:hypothetical protein
MSESKIPVWLWGAAVLVLIAQAGALFLDRMGRLSGPAHNVIPQILVAGSMALFLLTAVLVRHYGHRLPPAPSWLGPAILAAMSLGLSILYVRRFLAYFTLPYDLASWSEPMFIVDVLKWRTGSALYLPPGDSNSTPYTFLSPAITYWLAWLFGKSTSIPAFRLIQQLYLASAALIATFAARDLFRLAAPDPTRKLPRLWGVAFFGVLFLLATNPRTGVFNIFLHNDPLSLLVTAAALWVLLRHAATGEVRWLWVMAVIPTLGFFVKQYLVIWAAVYVVYLLLEGDQPLRRAMVFTSACFGILLAAIAACVAAWRPSFTYWIYEIMGAHVVTAAQMLDRFSEAAWLLFPGLFGGWILLREGGDRRLLGVWIGWLVMTLAGVYTSGITFHPAHLGPSTIVAGCFGLAALAKLWSEAEPEKRSLAHGWLQVGLCAVTAVLVFAGLGLVRRPGAETSSDVDRYAKAIEQEFQDLPPQRVLLDLGDWIYLREGIVMKDRAPILVTHRVPHYSDFLDRLRRQEYARILVHYLPDGKLQYDLGGKRGIENELRLHYHEVRRIPAARGVENWLYSWMMLGDIGVFEPNATEPDATRKEDIRP